MTAVQLHILCNKDEREEEDIKLDKQLAEMGLPPISQDELTWEWRQGYITAELIEAFYPAGKDFQHTRVHMSSGNMITVKETMQEVLALLVQPTLNSQQDGQRRYNYTANVSGVQ